MFGDFTASVVVLGCLLGWFGVLVGVRFVWIVGVWMLLFDFG